MWLCVHSDRAFSTRALFRDWEASGALERRQPDDDGSSLVSLARKHFIFKDVLARARSRQSGLFPVGSSLMNPGCCRSVAELNTSARTCSASGFAGTVSPTGSLLSLLCCCFGNGLGAGGDKCSGFPAGVWHVHWGRYGP